MPKRNDYRITNTRHVSHSRRVVTNTRGKYGGYGGSAYNNTGVYNRNINTRLNRTRQIQAPSQRGMYSVRPVTTRPMARATRPMVRTTRKY